MLILVGILLIVTAAFGQTPVDFVREVQPIFEERCYRCHAGDDAKGGFRLDARKRAFRGGNSGEVAIERGRPTASRLLRLVRGEEHELVMPPKGKRLSAEEITILERWIAGGAPWPDEVSGDDLVKEHWSFVPPKLPAVPKVKNSGWARSPIDKFILARLDGEGLSPALESPRGRLLRRVSLDLVGLPPTPEEVQHFVNDQRLDAYDLAVDRLLASPHFGERWARVWLDLARYADSKGYGSDPLRPYMWRWRDWVIDAFNRNLPYDQFTVAQLAGDLVESPTEDQILATAFHRNTMTNTEGGTDDEEFRIAAVKDRAETTAQVWLGLTLGCAECHSHKFDPISHRDYYRFFAVFNQTEDSDREDDEPRVATPTAEEKQQLAELERAVARVEAEAQRTHGDRRRAEEAQWKILKGEHVTSTPELHFNQDLRGVVTASQGSPDRAEYVFEAHSSAARVQAVRLEALADSVDIENPSPGRSPGNGNFVLNEIRLEAQALESSARSARFVRMRLPGKERILSLAEVEVLVGSDNIARSAKASQSSIDYEGDPKRAIDGNRDGHYFDAQSTTHSRIEDNPWFELDLGAVRELKSVRVWNRTDGGNGARLRGLVIELLDAERGSVFQAFVKEPPAPDLTIDLHGWNEIPLVDAEADFEQPEFGVKKAIDGNRGPRSGWAIGGAQSQSHEATFWPAAAIGSRGGQRLRVTLSQTYGDQHTLRRFRLAIFDGETAPTRGESESVTSAKRGLVAFRQQIVRTPILRELPTEKQRKSFVLNKGNHLLPGEEVVAGTPRNFLPAPESKTASRLDLARWITSPENSLTARVAVNRFWSQLFGRGLVATEEDFGTQGTPPSHPELLDWLALRFMECGWDTKALLKLLVTSSVYRQDVVASDATRERDPENRLLARFPRKRLEAEMVRDQALALSGLLASKIGGPSVFPPQPDGLWQAAFNGERSYPTSTGEARYRRGLYVFWRRTVPPPSFQTFDAPSREQCTSRRQNTNTPLQAFVTLNDPVHVEAAQALARRLANAPGDTIELKIRFGLRLVLAREPEDREVARLVQLHSDELKVFAADLMRARLVAGVKEDTTATDAAVFAAFTIVANVLLNLDAVLVVG